MDVNLPEQRVELSSMLELLLHLMPEEIPDREPGLGRAACLREAADHLLTETRLIERIQERRGQSFDLLNLFLELLRRAFLRGNRRGVSHSILGHLLEPPTKSVQDVNEDLLKRRIGGPSVP